MSATRAPSWWDRSDRPAHLEAVIFSVDAALADPGANGRPLADVVWDLHCAGVRVAAVTSQPWQAEVPPVSWTS